MNKLYSLVFGNVFAIENKVAKPGSEEKDIDNKSNSAKTQINPPLSVEQNSEGPTALDPKVVEFFKDFPEPLRQKVIKRYSSREGWYRWEFIREMLMQQEKESALRGEFLEYDRETKELERQVQEEERRNQREEAKKTFYEREIPEWEQALLKVIPLQPGDSMKLKLAEVSLFSLTGMLFLVTGISTKKNPKFTKWRANINLISSVNLFIGLQVGAVARLMDYGVFDNSVDDRPWFKKLIDVSNNAWNEVSKSKTS